MPRTPTSPAPSPSVPRTSGPAGRRRHAGLAGVLVLALVAVLGVDGVAARAKHVVPAPDAGGTGPFEDVAGTLHADAVVRLDEQAAAAPACATARFCPSDDASRAEVVAFLARALELPDGTATYADVPSTHVYAGDVAAATDAYVAYGCDAAAGLFCPDHRVTRGAVAALVARAFDLPDAPEPFKDVRSSAWYAGAVGALHEAGLTEGCNRAGTRFCPGSPVTRGQLAAIVTAALDHTAAWPTDGSGGGDTTDPTPEPTDGSGGGTTDPTPGPTEDPTPEPPTGVRDPLLWPYPWDSIWNMPVGGSARLVPARLERPTGRTLNIEEDLLFLPTDAPTTRPVMAHDAAWRNGVTRCGSRTGATVPGIRVPVPSGWTTEGLYHGSKPNHATAIVNPDMTLSETQPLHVCGDGVVVSQYDSSRWQGDSILTGGHGGSGGSHGGSFLTAFGGTIRLGEWVPGGRIPHTLKIVVDAEDLSTRDGGYRWPALRADRVYATTYTGDVPAARMGSLLALPPGFDVEGLRTEAARVLGRTLVAHGAYVVDVTGWSTMAFATEWSPRGRVQDEFQRTWGFPLKGNVGSASGTQKAFLQDVEAMYAALHVVDDNGAGTVGGAGARLAPYAPAFTDGTGGKR